MTMGRIGVGHIPKYIGSFYENTMTKNEVATCKSCKNQAWKIYKDHIECSKCGKTYHWPFGVSSDVKAQDIIHLTNDNY